MHFYHTLSSFQKRNYRDSLSGEMVMYMHFYHTLSSFQKRNYRDSSSGEMV